MKRALCWLTGFLLFTFGILAVAHAEGFTYGTWLPYWEHDTSMAELNGLKGKLDEAIAFECLFDNADQPKMLPDSVTLFNDITAACNGTNTTVFLSIVNDIELAPDQYDNKNSDLLRRLFADDASMTAHLEALTRLIDTYALTGLELDYENLKEDTTLWNHYTTFITRLWTVCERDGVRLRVVLPWDAPKYASLPKGPEYSVMCYNLYGYHSGPGPKADIAFLQTTCALYQPLGLNVRMAFATGGFDWHGDKIDALTQQEAQTALNAACVTPVRDPASGVLTATYTLDGETHTVWVADARTLSLWRDTCNAFGFNAFDLFRLGGNDLADWENALLGVQP